MMLKCDAQITGLPRTDNTAPGAGRCPEDHKLPRVAAQTGIEYDLIMSCR
jgi:hypothetical protein